ncbi:S-layer homology domain-containing protein [Evtepia sp.]|uniref:S-layer homology domain-containing protein n=1 Tax=Evtepia sp. TaxID=2773933 RepID=UPI003F15958B
MKRNQTMRRGLGILLSLVMCLSLLPATALADGVKTMTTGGIVAENQPFQVYLGDKPVSTVIVKYPINGGVQSFHWPNEAHRQDVQIQGKYLTVGGKYVSAGGNDSLVGLTLTGVEFDYLEIKYENGTRSGNFLVRWDSETNEYIYIIDGNFGAVSKANVTINGKNGTLSFQLMGEDNTRCVDFNPDEARRTVLTFEDRSKLPTTPLKPGDSYNHYLSSNNLALKEPLYAVVHGTNDCYQVYEGSDVGLRITSWDGAQRTAIARLTVSENSPLVGATFTGEEYNARMATFTGSNNSTKNLLVYEYSINPDANPANRCSYKCIVDGKIVDLENTYSGGWFTLTFEENGVRYEATAPEQNFPSYMMTNRVLFFKATDSPTATYTVSFDANGGTLNEGCKTSIETKANGTVDYLPRAAREDYIFDGWYTEKTGGEKVYTFITKFTDNTTVYAHWTPEADTKQITEAVFGLKGYAVGAKAEKIEIISYTDGLSLVGGYYESQGKPYSYLLGTDEDGDGEVDALVTGALAADKEYILMLKADLNAGYDVDSGLTEADVTLNSTIAAADCDKYKEESTFGITFELPVLKENDTPAAAYTVTVNGSNASVTGAGEYEAGDLVTLAAGSRSGYTFSGWTSDDITIPNASSADTSFVMPAKIVTVTANWTRIGGSSTPTYTPSVTQPENGTVTVSPKAPKKGDTVTITPKPEDGYTVEQILVTDKDGDPVKVTNNGDGTFSFTQPAGKVNVEVTFMEDNSMLNFFVDVPAGAYYYDAVLWAAENGITGGVDDTHFAPDASCTRAQMVTFLWRAAGSPKVSGSNPFSDVSADAYYYDAVLWAVEKGITSGTSATTFAPDATVTRGQTVTFLYRAAGSPAASGSGFSDVSSDAYYADAVAWAVQQNITTGTGDGKFSPDADCTRAQIVTFLFRAMGE